MIYLLYNNNINFYRRFSLDLVHIYLINEYTILTFMYAYVFLYSLSQSNLVIHKLFIYTTPILYMYIYAYVFFVLI